MGCSNDSYVNPNWPLHLANKKVRGGGNYRLFFIIVHAIKKSNKLLAQDNLPFREFS